MYNTHIKAHRLLLKLDIIAHQLIIYLRTWVMWARFPWPTWSPPTSPSSTPRSLRCFWSRPWPGPSTPCTWTTWRTLSPLLGCRCSSSPGPRYWAHMTSTLASLPSRSRWSSDQECSDDSDASTLYYWPLIGREYLDTAKSVIHNHIFYSIYRSSAGACSASPSSLWSSEPCSDWSGSPKACQ